MKIAIRIYVAAAFWPLAVVWVVRGLAGKNPVLSDSTASARPMGMKTRTLRDTEAAEIERDRSELHRKLDAIGAANKWLRTSLSKASGRYVGEQDVALLVRPVLNDLRGSGCLWVAVLYSADGSERSEWFGHDWYTALTSAVTALVTDDVLDLVQRQGGDYWFKFENIHGEEIFP